MTRSSMRRLRVLAVATGVFVLAVASAAVLLRTSGAPEPDAVRPPSPAPATTSSTPEPNGGETQTTGGAGDEGAAVQAALAYATAPQQWLYMADDEIRSAVAGLATPDAADRLSEAAVEEIASARDQLIEAAGPVWWLVHPLAWKVDRISANDATVSVWNLSFLSAADVAVPQTEWTIASFDLEWAPTEQQWQLAAVRDSVGPTPAVGPTDQPWEPEPLDDALEGFTRVEWEGQR